MGLSTLEVAANTYLIVLGDPAQGAFRLTFSQAFNGIGAFAGPLIASEYFFKGENATSLKNVQWTYLAVSIFGAILLVLFYFAQLPEIDEGALSDTLENQDDVKPIYKQWHTIFGFFAQFAYVGAQVAVATFAVNLFSDTPSVGFTASKGALYYSYCQMVFALGRFIGAAVLKYCDPAYSLTVYALACALFTLGITQASGNGIIACMFLVFFFESICWPTIYALAVSRLGKHTKLGGSLVVSGVGGGALFAPVQGVLADAIDVRTSYWVSFIGFFLSAVYGLGMSIDGLRRRKIDGRTGKLRQGGVAELESPSIEEKPDTQEKEDARKS
ncbi:hypothetical protein FRC15_004315 [Serendipita sp. 397]|nr:hypothetical protein FRC15_004315 [Serendipita sp. 397]